MKFGKVKSEKWKVKSVILKLKRSFVLNSIHSFYVDQDYDLILKHLPKPFSLKRDDEVISNIFRILALKNIGDITWKLEWEHLNNQGSLDIFDEKTKNYLQIMLQEKLFGKYQIQLADFSTLSKKIQKYFPE